MNNKSRLLTGLAAALLLALAAPGCAAPAGDEEEGGDTVGVNEPVGTATQASSTSGCGQAWMDRIVVDRQALGYYAKYGSTEQIFNSVSYRLHTPKSGGCTDVPIWFQLTEDQSGNAAWFASRHSNMPANWYRNATMNIGYSSLSGPTAKIGDYRTNSGFTLEIYLSDGGTDRLAYRQYFLGWE